MQNTQVKRSGFLASFLEFFFLLLCIFLIRTVGFGLYKVPTGSMETTLLVGENFIADKFSYLFRKPKRGEIISLNDPTYCYSQNPVKNLYERYIGINPFLLLRNHFERLTGISTSSRKERNGDDSGWGPSNWTKRVIGLPGEHVRGVIENGKAVIYINNKKLDEPYLNKYPLIHELSIDLNKWKQNKFALQGVRELIKSYDPSMPYDQQPFYRINPNRLDDAEHPHLTWPSEVTYYHQGQQIWKSQHDGKPNGSDEFSVQLGEDEYWLMGDNRRGSKDSRFFGAVPGKLIHGRIVFRLWSFDSEESWLIKDLVTHPIDLWNRARWSRFFQRVF